MVRIRHDGPDPTGSAIPNTAGRIVPGTNVADPGSGSLIFFPGPGSRIQDPFHVPNSIYLQDVTFKNGEKQEKFNFVWNVTSILTYSSMKKVSFIFPSLICRIRIRDKRRSDPDSGYQKIVESGSATLPGRYLLYSGSRNPFDLWSLVLCATSANPMTLPRQNKALFRIKV
jgi:hypothetical protein